MAHVSLTIVDRIAHVELTRPEKMNAISLEMLDAVIDTAHHLKDADVRCVVISGEGRAFCAGIDIVSLSSLMGQDMEDVLVQRQFGATNRFQEFALAWRALDVPVIAALHGACFGAGLQLAAGADIRIASPDAKLSVMEMKWGLVPDMGGMVLLPHLLRSDILRRLTYTAEVIDAIQAEKWGLVTEISDAPLERAMETARTIAVQSPSAMKAAKALIGLSETGVPQDVLMAESVEQAKLIGKPDQMAAIARGMAKKPSKMQ